MVRYGVLLALGCCVLALDGAASATMPAAPQATNTVSVLTAEQVIQILDESVEWYRTLTAQQQVATQPSDLLTVFANRQIAGQVVGLAFDIARANAELLSSEAVTAASPADSGEPGLAAFEQEHAQVDSQVDAIQQEIARGPAKQEVSLQGELAMLKARKNLLDTMGDFVAESNPKGASTAALKSQIDAIAATIPQLGLPGAPTAPTTATPASVPAASNEAKSASGRTSVWDLASAALSLKRKVKMIAVLDEHTVALDKLFADFSAPSTAQLKSYTARSEALAAQARSADPDAQRSLRAEFDTLAWLFKQTSDILLPLDKEHVLLQQYRHNLANWRAVVQSQYSDALVALGIRLGILLGILATVVLLGEIWRRAVLRFTHEPRRRGQLLLMQRIVVWAALVAIAGLSFTTELSTFATFAGLLTAGVAVAMQNVLVSVVGYFFLIGKYGIRVGDRIQVGAVTGEVIDIGLVRMHLMELNSTGPLGPTGRVVAFANLIVFQASGGLFKQIPGVNLSWHESSLNLPPLANYGPLKEKLQSAIAAVLTKYQAEFSRQSREIERTTSTVSADATQFVQMHLVDGRMVAVIRYPVHLENSAEIDEHVGEAILTVIEHETKRSDVARESDAGPV